MRSSDTDGRREEEKRKKVEGKKEKKAARRTASASGLTPLSISEMHIDSSRRSRWQFCGEKNENKDRQGERKDARAHPRTWGEGPVLRLVFVWEKGGGGRVAGGGGGGAMVLAMESKRTYKDL